MGGIPTRGNRLPLIFSAALLLAFVFSVAFASNPAGAAALTFPTLTGRVVDDAHLLDAGTTANLSAKLAAFEQKSGTQLVVATLPSLQGHEI